MKYLKKFEDIDENNYDADELRERILSDVAIYLEDLLKKEINSFEECIYSDYKYDTEKIIEYEFSFLSLDMDEDDDETFDKFTKEYNLGEYSQSFVKYEGRGYFIFTIPLTDDRIEELYKDSEIFNSSRKYNL